MKWHDMQESNQAFQRVAVAYALLLLFWGGQGGQ